MLGGIIVSALCIIWGGGIVVTSRRDPTGFITAGAGGIALILGGLAGLVLSLVVIPG